MVSSLLLSQPAHGVSHDNIIIYCVFNGSVAVLDVYSGRANLDNLGKPCSVILGHEWLIQDTKQVLHRPRTLP